ncbi:MAG: hypothetical protein JNG84_11750, partial [Archangium sp.]|nr:hypothetical protein [Archangium sp.]
VLLGVRLTRNDVLFKGFSPYLGAQVGPTLALISTASFVTYESALFGTSINGGATWRFTERVGITLDVRWLFARFFVPTISGANVGGLFVSAGVTIFLPAAPARKDMAVPGF